MSLFKVGEVAIVAHSALPQFPVGSEVTILEVVENPIFPGAIYVVDRQFGDTTYASDRCLRKKRPPESDRTREQLGEWDLCPWQPARKEAMTP